MKTVEIIFVFFVFAASLIYALRTVFGPFLSKKGDNGCQHCPMAGKCKEE
ncbi:MAG: hypothetical protein WC180_02240 [Candidatus Paceibacterota bacterium]